jgi:hypothetical protein
MQKLIISKNGQVRKVFGLPPVLGCLLVIIVFAGVFALTRGYLRILAVDQVLLQGENWNKDGVLMQGNKYTCVPASVVMLLKDEKVTTDTLEITELGGTNTEGTECGDIPKIGEHFGFNVRQERLGFDKFMETGLPAIISFKWQGTLHAVYAKPDRQNGWIVVKDPSVGLSTIDKKNMKEYFGTDEVDCYLFVREKE